MFFSFPQLSFPSSSSSSHPILMSSTKITKVLKNVGPWDSPENTVAATKWNIPIPNIPRYQTSVSSSLKLSNSNLDLQYGNENGWNVKSFENALIEISKDPLESLNFIDAAQRLGIDYHFETQIDAILKWHYEIISQSSNNQKSNLREVSLRLRLLRQHGYFVPANVLKAFVSKEGQFKKGLKEDMMGLMSLYEASHFCLPGEVILEEAGKFSAQILKTICLSTSIDNNQADYVSNTLANPYHMSLSKFMVKSYFGIEGFQATNKWINALQQVAKMDFNIVQRMHHQEIFQISQWWKETGLAKELGFARNQPIKWYLCSLGCLTDPNLWEERVDLTKPISFVYLIDDIFDLYGSLRQLTLFAEAVKRWDLSIAETLPDCMKICLKSLYEMTNEISSKVHHKYGWNPIHSLQKSWAKLCDAFLQESIWFGSGDSPTADEYLRNGIISSGVHVVLVHVFFLLGQGITKETVQFLDSNPEIISSAATILRLHDDLGNAQDENQDGYDGSYIEYYMKEYKDVSLESTKQHMNGLISYAWKRLNRASLSPNPFPISFTKASLNIARGVPLLYGYHGSQNLPILEKLVKSLLHECV